MYREGGGLSCFIKFNKNVTESDLFLNLRPQIGFMDK